MIKLTEFEIPRKRTKIDDSRGRSLNS